jgi:hypothetical protein
MKNNPNLAGQLASKKVLFGGYSRFAIAPVHTRFDDVEWFVWDANHIDPLTKLPSVIAQEPTKEQALAKVGTNCVAFHDVCYETIGNDTTRLSFSVRVF